MRRKELTIAAKPTCEPGKPLLDIHCHGGYGDVVLVEHWHLLSSFKTANGYVMFGWTTAIVIAAVQRIYFSEKHSE